MVEGQPLIDWGWIARNLGDIGQRTWDHVVLTVLAVGIGFVISFGLALLIRRQRWLTGPILAVSGVLYSIPSLAFFMLLIPLTGIQSIVTAEIALVSYTILILVRNTLAGFDGVPPEVLEAAEGMGYSPWQRLWRVELPIAAPVIIAGLRIATVTTVGLVTVTAFIGIQSLGSLIVNVGLARFFLTATLVGSLGAVLLAVAADLGLVLLQRLVTPWSRDRALGT
jgi:osmoprotectant transport system permease protein